MKKPVTILLAAILGLAIWSWWPSAPVSITPVATPSPGAASPPPVALTADEKGAAAADEAARDLAPRRAVIPDGSSAYRVVGRARRVAATPMLGARVLVFEEKTTTVSGNVPGAQMWRMWMADLVQLDDTAGLVAHAPVADDGSFVIDEVRGLPGSRLAVTLSHELYGMVSPHALTLPGVATRQIDIGELDTYLGAFVSGRLVGFSPVAGTEVRLACEADQMAAMRDPSLFRLQVMGFQRLVQTAGADARFTFKAVPQTARARVLATGANEAVFGEAMTLMPGDRREVLVVGHSAARVTVTVATENGAPLADAHVRLFPRAIDGTQARTLGTRDARTAADGRASPSGLTPGPWFARVEAPALAPATQPIEITGRADEVFAFVLREGGVVSGRVVDAEGKPVESAGIAHQPSLDVPFLGNLASQYGAEQFASLALDSRTRSDAEGRFRLAGLTYEKAFTLVVAHAEYLASVTEGKIGADDLTIVLSRGAGVRAIVLDGRDGKPVPRFTATLLRTVMGMMEMPTRSETVADAAGRLALNRLPAGSLKLRLEADGLAWHETDVRLSEEKTLDLGEIRLGPPARIEGKVLDVRGQPVARAKVRVLRGGVQDNEMFAAMTGAKRGVLSGADGAFVLDDVVPGRVRLQATADGFAPTQTDRLTVEVDRPLRDVVLTLGHGGAIAGRVLLPPGADPTRWRVIASEIRAADTKQTEPGGDGAFRVENLLGGRYNVQAMDVMAVNTASEAFADDLTEGRPMDFGKMMQSMTQSMVQTRCLVKDGETTEIELDARSLASAGTRLVVDVFVGDERLTDGFVEVADAAGGGMQMAVLIDGSFVVESVNARQVVVQVRQGMALAPVGEPTRIEIPAGADEHKTTLRLAGGRLSGRVVHDSTGDPLGGALVRVRGANAATDREPDIGFALTDALGHFTITGLAAGAYSLVADDGLKPEGGRAGGRLEGIQLANGEHRGDLVLRARPTAGVRVRVIDDRGVGVPHAFLIATDAEGNVVGSRSVNFADGEGRAFLSGLPAGAIRIAARGAGHAPGVSDVREVAPGAETELTVRLAHGTRVDVTVAGADGRPWRDAVVAVRIGTGPWIPASLLQATPTEGGAIDLGELPPGAVAFRVYGAGTGSFEVRRTVPPGRRVSLVLTPDAR